MYKIFESKWRVYKTVGFAILVLFLLVLSFDIELGNDIDIAKQKSGYSSGIMLEYSYGYEEIAKLGRYLPINISLANIQEEDLEGEVIFRVQGEKYYEYKYPISLLRGEAWSQDYFIFTDANANFLDIYIKNQRGEDLAQRSIPLDPKSNHNKLMIGILSDETEKLQYLDNVSINYGLLTSKVIDLTKFLFPDTKAGLDQLDIIVISNYRIRDLGKEQSRALMDWVKSGGVMILGTGNRVGDTLGRFAPELLEDIYEDPQLREVKLGEYEEGSVAAQNESAIEVPIVDINLHGGNIIMSDEDTSLVSVVNREKGLIAVSAYDFCDISSYAQTHNSYVDSLMGAILGANRINDIAYNYSRADEIAFNSVQPMINGVDFRVLPSKWRIFFPLIIYILIMGWISKKLLSKYHLMIYYRRIVLLASIVFSIFIYLLGSGTRFEEAFYDYATILDVSEENISEKSFFSVRNPYNRPYEVSINAEYSVLPMSKQTVQDTNVMQSNELGSVAFSYYPEETKIDIGYVGAFQPVSLELERNISNQEDIGFVGEITLFENEIHGEITNKFGYRVVNSALLLYDKIVLLGDFEAGERKVIDGLDVYNIPINNAHLVASTITGVKDIENDNAAFSKDNLLQNRNNMLGFFISYYMSGFTADAKMVAFVDAPIQSRILIEDKPKHSEMTLLSSGILINNILDGLICRNILMKMPRIISGEYYRDYNYIYALEPTVLEYDLGDDIEIETLRFEEISKKFIGDTSLNTFEGSISFYNVVTGGYDDMDIAKVSFDKEALKEYISNENTIIIRYAYGGDMMDGGGGVILPNIYTVGRIR